jgi:hypothetical protein
MNIINHEKTPEILRQMREIGISAYDVYTIINELKLNTSILMLLVDTMPMEKVEEIVQHKKEDWG